MAKLEFGRNLGAAATCRLSEEGLRCFCKYNFETKFARRARSLPSQEGNLMEMMSCLYTFHSTHLPPYTVRSIFLNTVISYTLIFQESSSCFLSLPHLTSTPSGQSYFFLFGYIGLFLFAESRGYFSLQCEAYSLRWLLVLQSTGSRAGGAQLKGYCPLAYGIFLEQGPNLYPLH